MSLRDQIKAASQEAAKARTERIAVPGGEVEVRGMMAGDLLRVGEATNQHGARRGTALIVALCSFDPASGEQLWNPNDGSDLEEVCNLDPSVFDPIRDAATRLSGLDERVDAEGNPPGSPTKSSSSSSPESSGGAPPASGAS